MIHLSMKLPRKVYLACSGGVDSIAAYDFLSKNHEVVLCFFHHGTETSEKSYQFLKNFNSKLIVGNIKREKKKEESIEEYWRNQRYEFFHSFYPTQILTCHHLDDCVETWIWSSLHGEGKLIPFSNKNVIRPFLRTRKSSFQHWAFSRNLRWIEDDSNNDIRYVRNFIRKEIVPKALMVNPGLYKMINKKLIEKLKTV
jgi:tRNA(Ile)-lysidine synthase